LVLPERECIRETLHFQFLGGEAKANAFRVNSPLMVRKRRAGRVRLPHEMKDAPKEERGGLREKCVEPKNVFSKVARVLM